jgi:hypothetical protein
MIGYNEYGKYTRETGILKTLERCLRIDFMNGYCPDQHVDRPVINSLPVLYKPVLFEHLYVAPLIMINEFTKLNDQEVELMLKAPILVCILIAGADGTIDHKEIKEAIAIARKNFGKKGVLAEYFRELSQDFEDKLKITIQGYPYESTQRTPMIIEELAQLSRLWPKFDKPFAQGVYDSLRDIAEKIASSSGGVLGLKSVGSEEAKYIQLPMIQKP